ncbi:HAD-IA family hydrolase [Leadbettera azotonutricia]|uniref:Pyrimidine 5'-nucleotidase n=1 Tax=Leadbettera azotonutricia (strain ATCC BAA-888 / DSM 13862 / ZAS-9) TaxID=545695 RepID=F5YB53_LEAAZ|nr:HAD-IA family hydrolase [Leadbettera azotonutricia]AEF80528.1 pyrimidine 5'-nucleotidase [Leadbettera azotonutricia ZAS-9]
MIKQIIFDLDNTLYSPRHGLEIRVMKRVNEFVAAYLGLSAEEAIEERRKHIAHYGTTLEWLRAEKGFTDIETYFKAVHPENEADDLLPDPELRSFLQGLPCPYAILTNAPIEHAERLLRLLGAADLFTEIFDIRRLNYRGKPRPDAYRFVLESLGQKAGETLFIDDVPKYVEGFLDIGGRGVLIDELDEFPGYPHEKIRALRELNSLLN